MEEKKYLKRKEKALIDGSHDSLAVACHNLGEYYKKHKKYTEAVREYEEEAYIYRILGRKLKMSQAHHMAGEMLLHLCDFTSAMDHISIYLKSATKLKNKVEEQQAYACLGRAYLLQGQRAIDAESTLPLLKNAETAFIRSLLISKELSGWMTKQEQLDIQARLFLNIGAVKEHMEDFEESIEYIEKAIKISKANEIFELLHPCYMSVSLLHEYKKNNSKLALKYCNLALEVAKRLPNNVKKACETLILKAEILIREGDFSAAKLVLTKAHKKNTPDEKDRQTIEKALRAVSKICQTLDKLVTMSCSDYAKRKKLFDQLGGGIRRLSPIVDSRRKQQKKIC